MTTTQSSAAGQPQIVGRWRKSGFSSASDCVQLAETTNPQVVAMRNSNDVAQGTLFIERGMFGHLVDRIKAGELDHLVA
jgi:hypothetical protein